MIIGGHGLITEAPMDLGLTGKRALVLGATRGLGRAIGEALAAEGVTLAITGRKQADATSIAAQIASAHGANVHGLAFDATDAASATALIESARSVLGDIDILVLNGGGPPPGPITSVTSDTWQQQFQAQFLGFVTITEAFLLGMRERKWGRILVSSSSGVVQPIPNLGISNTLRAGLLGWAKTLSAEVAPDGVTVNTMLPGRIETARLDQIDAATAERTGQTLEQVRAASVAAIPAGRLGTTREYGATAAFLVSDHAAYITGATIRVDGGATRSI
jgi:3-oxoacyl-[acyl-carrier protein] reductase